MSQSPLVALYATLQEAERFIAGFEDDEALQPPVTILLANLRAQITLTEVALDAEAAAKAAQAACASIGAAHPADDPVKTAARKAIHYLLRRIQRDPRLAYHFDPITRSMEELTLAHALLHGLELEVFRKEYFASLRFTAPTCSECGRAA